MKKTQGLRLIAFALFMSVLCGQAFALAQGRQVSARLGVLRSAWTELDAEDFQDEAWADEMEYEDISLPYQLFDIEAREGFAVEPKSMEEPAWQAAEVPALWESTQAPALPVITQAPALPEAPEAPAALPEATRAPALPEAPEAPAALPEGTKEPAWPENTQAPTQIEAPEVPALPEATEAPALPEATVTPALPESTEVPALPEPTVTPALPETTEEPVLPEATEVPERSIVVSDNIGNTASFGDRIVLKARLIGYDDVAYALQWQVNRGNGWTDLPSEQGGSYAFILDEENFSYQFRLAVSLL